MGRMMILIVSLGLLATLSFVPGPAEKVVFLDVGQGDSILLQEGTAQVLIDGGPGMAVLERLGEELPWFDRRIEVIISTHPDRDHLEGLMHVLNRYEVGLVLLPQLPHTSHVQAAWLQRLSALVEQGRLAYRFAWAGQRLRVSENLVVELLGPYADRGAVFAPGGKTNNGAVLARVDFGEMSFLLTSDAEAAVERRLVAEAGERLDVDVLKAGHHGSKTSTTRELLEAASPAAAIISVGRENRFGHPHSLVLQRLEGLDGLHLWRTDEHGSVRFERWRGRWFVKT